MKILILNTNNPLREAGVVALDLLNNFQREGHEVRLLVKNYYSGYPKGIVSMGTGNFVWAQEKLNKILWWFNRLKEKLIPPPKTDLNYCFFSLNEQKLVYRTNRLLKKAGIKPDAIIILYAKRFINLRNISELHKKTDAPIYWLMYDMAPLTGGCHYAWECQGYQNQCGNCPGLFSSNPFDNSHTNYLYKKKFIDKTNVQIIAGSEWQYRQAKKSSLFMNKPIHKIFTSINSDIFKPLDKEDLRSKMGIQAYRKVLFFGSVGLTEKRKGMNFLIESLRILKDKIANCDLKNDILLLIAGGEIKTIAESLPFEYHYLGMLNNTYELASAYQASDVFICPSIEDAGPTMINQSIMCGTPVVAFDMGIAPDLVLTGQTGYKAKLKDSYDLARGIFNILSLEPERYKLCSINCRNLALKLYRPEVNYMNWMNILNNNHRK